MDHLPHNYKINLLRLICNWLNSFKWTSVCHTVALTDFHSGVNCKVSAIHHPGSTETPMPSPSPSPAWLCVFILPVFLSLPLPPSPHLPHISVSPANQLHPHFPTCASSPHSSSLPFSPVFVCSLFSLHVWAQSQAKLWCTAVLLKTTLPGKIYQRVLQNENTHLWHSVSSAVTNALVTECRRQGKDCKT